MLFVKGIVLVRMVSADAYQAIAARNVLGHVLTTALAEVFVHQECAFALLDSEALIALRNLPEI